MHTVLITGASGFLGYHVARRLNERGVTPRVLLPRMGTAMPTGDVELRKLQIEVFEGDVTDSRSLAPACAGADTVLHLSFVIDAGDGPEAKRKLHAGNVLGTRNVIDAATAAGAECIVVSSSALTVGLSRGTHLLDETADWNRVSFDLPYALSRREAEIESLSRPGGAGKPRIVAVNPSFTLGPLDFVGAPANKLVKKMSGRNFRLSAPIGFGVLDVRDYAEGVLQAAERGRHGSRYVLSGENLNSDRLRAAVAEVCEFRPARLVFSLPRWLMRIVIAVARGVGRLKGKPASPSYELLGLWGRKAWFDTSLAGRELGWRARPLRETLEDTLQRPRSEVRTP